MPWAIPLRPVGAPGRTTQGDALGCPVALRLGRPTGPPKAMPWAVPLRPVGGARPNHPKRCPELSRCAPLGRSAEPPRAMPRAVPLRSVGAPAERHDGGNGWRGMRGGTVDGQRGWARGIGVVDEQDGGGGTRVAARRTPPAGTEGDPRARTDPGPEPVGWPRASSGLRGPAPSASKRGPAVQSTGPQRDPKAGGTEHRVCSDDYFSPGEG